MKLNRLSDLQQLIEYEFRNFTNYLRASHSLFDDQTRKAEVAKKEFIDAIIKLKSDNGGEIDPDSPIFGRWEELSTDSYLTELEIEALRDMQRVFANSSFLFLVALFEGSLKRICDAFITPERISPKNINEQSYAMKARLFLSKVVGITLPDDPKWLKLRKFLELRNAIAHDNGTVFKHSEKSFANQSDRYKTVYEFKSDLHVFEGDDSITFHIEKIEFIENAATFLREFAIEIGLNAIESASVSINS
jgi:hypothetical protein